MIPYDNEILELQAKLKGSLIEFSRFFYPLLTSRDFIIPHPICRESHIISICRELTKCLRLEQRGHRLIINVPPGHGKSTLLVLWMAWCFTHYPDSRFMYISYSKSLAAKHTETLKRLMSLKEYQYLFGIKIRHDSKAKEFFQTEQGGQVAAFGSQGAIVGVDAGLPALDRFSGALIMDDMHKIDEAHSDLIRENVINNYRETIQQRARSANVQLIFIGQRVHEDDLPAYLLSGKDGYEWNKLILKSIDSANNALYPEAFPLDMLEIKRERDPYVFMSQYQQEPVGAGAGLFKREWFYEMDLDPEILVSFITCDTSETDKSWNDATAFSFWGIYELKVGGKGTGQLALHWLDTYECRVEPKNLEGEFLNFYANCNNYKVPPLIAAIEKKSTGVTLVSTLKNLRGLSIREIERSRASGSKTQRFIDIQSFIASKRISYTCNAPHMEKCLAHMEKITANSSHRFDDIADTVADAVKLALIDKTVYAFDRRDNNDSSIMAELSQQVSARVNASRVQGW